MATIDFDEVFVSVIADGDADDLKKWTRRCLDNGSSFAVIDGRMYLSQASQDLIVDNKPLPKAG